MNDVTIPLEETVLRVRRVIKSALSSAVTYERDLSHEANDSDLQLRYTNLS